MNNNIFRISEKAVRVLNNMEPPYQGNKKIPPTHHHPRRVFDINTVTASLLLIASPWLADVQRIRTARLPIGQSAGHNLRAAIRQGDAKITPERHSEEHRHNGRGGPPFLLRSNPIMLFRKSFSERRITSCVMCASC